MVLKPEEREILERHVREQCALGGVASPDEPVLDLLVSYVHDSRMATGPNGYARAYQVIKWCMEQGGLKSDG